jgi:hypothetical protein
VASIFGKATFKTALQAALQALDGQAAKRRRVAQVLCEELTYIHIHNFYFFIHTLAHVVSYQTCYSQTLSGTIAPP